MAETVAQAWKRPSSVVCAVLLGLAVAALGTGCGASSRQRQAWMLAQEEAAAAAGEEERLDGDRPTSLTAASRGGPDADGAGGIAENIDLATYRLGPGDLLDIKFLFHPEENQRAPVRADGYVNLPVTGDVVAAGRSVPELQAAIVERSSVSLRDPKVSILIVQLAERRIFVTGQVARPGYVPFRPGTTPLQAVLERGGFLDDAQTDQVIHLRRVGGAIERNRIDLESAVEGKSADAIALAPNDVLIVPRTFIGDAGLFVDQWIRGLLPSIPQPGYDLPLLFF